jgi:hypothetical protein
MQRTFFRASVIEIRMNRPQQLTPQLRLTFTAGKKTEKSPAIITRKALRLITVSLSHCAADRTLGPGRTRTSQFADTGSLSKHLQCEQIVVEVAFVFTCGSSPSKFKVVTVGTGSPFRGATQPGENNEKDLHLGSCCGWRALANRRFLLGKIGRSGLWSEFAAFDHAMSHCPLSSPLWHGRSW